METYHSLCMNARARLMPIGERAAQTEARYLVMRAAGKTFEELTRDYRMYASDKICGDVAEMLERRLNGEPLAYITGSWEFYGLPLAVTRDVLIPRVDTEVLAGAAIERAKGAGDGCRVLDLCAGSGCIGLAVAHNVPSARVTVADDSEAALKVAKLNARALNLTVTPVRADVFGQPPPALGSFDIIVCNPPYIATAEIQTLDMSVRDYEPLRALDGGADGLDFYRAVTRDWSRLLRGQGCVMFEIGAGQASAVKKICYRAGLAAFETLIDTNGIERVLITSPAEV